MIFLCKGTKLEKIEAAFRVYDKDGSDGLDLAELTDYLTGIMCMKLPKLQNGQGEADFKTEKDRLSVLAASLALRSFNNFGKQVNISENKEGKDEKAPAPELTLDEFVEFVQGGGMTL